MEIVFDCKNSRDLCPLTKIKNSKKVGRFHLEDKASITSCHAFIFNFQSYDNPN